MFQNIPRLTGYGCREADFRDIVAALPGLAVIPAPDQYLATIRNRLEVFKLKPSLRPGTDDADSGDAICCKMLRGDGASDGGAPRRSSGPHPEESQLAYRYACRTRASFHCWTAGRRRRSDRTLRRFL